MLSITNKILRNNQYLNRLIISSKNKINNNNGVTSLSSLINNENNIINFKRYYSKKHMTYEYDEDSDFEKKSHTVLGLDEDKLDGEFDEMEKNRKIEKSKREINHKKHKKVTALELFLNETSKITEPQVDLVDDDQLHVFPPQKNHKKNMTNSARHKHNQVQFQRSNNALLEPDEYENEDELLSEGDENGGELFDANEYDPDEDFLEGYNTASRQYGDLDDQSLDEEDLEEQYEDETPDIIAMDLEEMELMKRREVEREKLAKKTFEVEKRKKKILKEVGFGDDEILNLFKETTTLSKSTTKKFDKRSKYIQYKIFSHNKAELSDLSVRLFEIDTARGVRTNFNDDVLQVDQVQVVDVDGTNVGIMTGPKAFRYAYVRKMDIFLSYGANNKVYGRLMAFEDFIKITEKKIIQEKEKRENVATKTTKNVLISSNISENDRLTKFDQIKKFLLRRHSVEVTITFKDENTGQEDGKKIFSLLDSEVHGIGKVQSRFEKEGGLVSRFYQPLTLREREAFLLKVEKSENSEKEKLTEKLERDEIDRLDELGLDIDPVQLAATVAAGLKKIQLQQELAKENITQAEYNLFEEEEKEKEKKRKEKEEKFKLAPVSGEGLSNKQIKQNLNKNKKLEKQLKNKNKKNFRNNDDEELF